LQKAPCSENAAEPEFGALTATADRPGGRRGPVRLGVARRVRYQRLAFAWGQVAYRALHGGELLAFLRIERRAAVRSLGLSGSAQDPIVRKKGFHRRVAVQVHGNGAAPIGAIARPIK